MRSSLLALALAALFVVGCHREDGGKDGAVVARWRFRGVEFLGNESRIPQLKAALALPEAALVGPRAATNIAAALVQRLTGTTNASLGAQLHPLVQALARHESAGEIAAGGWSLAVKVPAAESTAAGNSVMSLPRMPGQAAGVPAVQYTNGWILAGSTAAWIGRAAALPPLANDRMLSGDFDLAVIGNSDPKHWPKVHLEAFATNGMVRTSGRLVFASAPMGSLPEWKIPDTLIHDPIIQFTTARGIDGFVAANPWFQTLSGGTAPAQTTVWSQPEVPFRTWFSAPVEDGPARIAKVQESLDKRLGTNPPAGEYRGVTVLNTNKTAVAVYDPVAVKGLLPSVSTARQKEQDFLVTSIIRPSKSTNPMPVELLGELNTPDLVYYDWEITAEMYSHWNVLFQYNNLIRGIKANAFQPRAYNWIAAAAPKFGNSVTTVRRVSPTEFDLSRSSSAGLTSLEWVLLTRFLDGPIVTQHGGAQMPVPGLPAPHP